MTDVVIEAMCPSDVGEVLTLQRAAYVTEAQIYRDTSLPPLLQTYDELAAEVASSLGLKATLGNRIVGSGCARHDGSTLHIGRLVVAPDMQGRGIGTRLLLALEHLAPPAVDRLALFTGHLSAANLRLYQRLGYAETHRHELNPGLSIVHLEKKRTAAPQRALRATARNNLSGGPAGSPWRTLPPDR